MATHGPAYLLAGDCQAVPLRICMPFKEFCIHTLSSSPALGQPTNPEAGTFGCMAAYVNPGTQFLPIPKIPSNTNRAPLYGRTSDNLTLENYFMPADLAPWRSRKILGPTDPYNKHTSGPALQQGHMVTMLRRRLRSGSPNNNNYNDRYSFYFTDSSTPLGGNNDWLRSLHPGHLFWTNKNINEPFSAIDYYEQTGQIPVGADSYNQYFIPFCSPVNCYNSAGNIIGSYVGYTFIFYFSYAYIRVPKPANLPEDYHVQPPQVPPVKVVPTNQFFSLDCHWFLVASPAYTGSEIRSPKLQSVRYWLYNKFGTSYNPCDPYIYWINGDMTSQWNFDVTFNHYGGGSEVIKFGMSNINFYVTP